MATVTAMLSKDQRSDINDWYHKVSELLLKGNQCVSYSDNRTKIKRLTKELLRKNSIDVKSAKVADTIEKYQCRDYLRAMGYNLLMQPETEESRSKREAYYVFTLAAYISYWFNGMKSAEVENRYGEEVCLVRQVAENIVARYVYPWER